jgi:arsenate reductase
VPVRRAGRGLADRDGIRTRTLRPPSSRGAGVDLADRRRTQKPKVLTPEDSQASTVVITMSCGDVCPYYPGRRHEDWDIPDPAGQDLDTVRTIRDDIGGRVRALVDDLTR